jgi:prevent-host-death family protein
MDVAVTQLRADLKRYLERAGAGEDVIVTDRGVPVARLTAVDSLSMIERLTREGVISAPARPEGRRAATLPRVKATAGAPISDLVSELRR